MKRTRGLSTKSASSSEVMIFERCVIGDCPETRRLFASSETWCRFAACCRQAGQFEWRKASLTELLSMQSQNVSWRAWASIPSEGCPWETDGTTLLCKGRGAGDPRCLHARPRLFQLLKDHSRAKCTRQDESTADMSGDLPLTTNHGCRTWTLCMHQTNRRSCPLDGPSRISLVQDGAVVAAPH